MTESLPTSWRHLFNGAFVAIIATLIISCDDLNTQPGEFEYPISLSIERKQSVAELSWTEVTVSTFEEYIILRSTEPIPDSPEPEVSGNTVIIARVDERQAPVFKDSNLPITDTLFYKVYARIAGRLLMSPTVAYAQNLHLIPVRTDIIEHVPEKNTFVAFDRGTQQLFVYNYLSREILVSRAFQLNNFPIIKYDASTNEILLTENSPAQFLDYNTLSVKQTFQNSFARTADYSNGWIYLTRNTFPHRFALYRRSDLSLRDELGILQVDWRDFYVIPDPGDVLKATIYDFSLNGIARYLQNSSDLTLDLESTDVNSGGAIIIASHPTRTEFVYTNNGVIVDGNLQLVNTLENGTLSFGRFAFTPDGSRLFGLTFQGNNQVIKAYDPDNEYAVIEEFIVSNQISPMAMFTDDQNLYLVSLVFIAVGTQTLITTIEY